MPDILAALRWFLVLELIGLAGLPLARWLFTHLPGGGYGFAKPFALLLASYLLWLLGTFGFLSLQGSSFVLCLLVVLAIGLILRGNYHLQREEIRAAVGVEVVFTLAYAAAVLLRAYNPEISATEKPMEFAFLNSILRSGDTPPPDPWMSGYAISYYYFGYLMVAALSRLAAVTAAQAFNLGIATLFALTVTGAFVVVRGMVAHREGAPPDKVKPSLFGLLAGIVLAIMGNLEGFLEVLHARGIGPAGFWKWLDIKDLLETPQSGSWMPSRYLWWWRASRVINDRSPLGNPMEVIDEFPFFSFLLGDMHPHVLALPFVILAVAVCFEWGVRLQKTSADHDHRRFLVLTALTIGALGFLNTWDWPVYLVLFAAVTWLGLPALPVRKRLWQAICSSGLLALIGLLAYLPFFLSFRSQAAGFIPTFLVSTKLRQFAVMFGPFIFVAVFYAFRRLQEQQVPSLRRFLAWMLLLFLVPYAFLSVLGLGLLALPTGQQLLSQLGGIAEVRQLLGDGTWWAIMTQLLLDKLASPFMLLFVSSIIAACMTVIEQVRVRQDGRHESQPDGEESEAEAPAEIAGDFSDNLALAMIAIAFALTWAVEFVYLRDYFGTRMNTVFKFYYQAWVLLALACTYGAYYLWDTLKGITRWVFTVPALAMVLMGMIYAPLATWTKTDGFSGLATLDGTKYLETTRPSDYEAIRWLNANVAGNPIIVEAIGGSYSEYARVSANTGLPTILGWQFHEQQWGRDLEEIERRRQDVERLYTTLSWEEIEEILRRYGVRYVFVGPLERQTYGPQLDDWFSQRLGLAYHAAVGNETVSIYEFQP